MNKKTSLKETAEAAIRMAEFEEASKTAVSLEKRPKVSLEKSEKVINKVHINSGFIPMDGGKLFMKL